MTRSDFAARLLRPGYERLTQVLAAALLAAGINRAVAYGLLGRSWSFLAGPVTLYLITLRLTPEVQGFHYTFASLIALQSFVELGFAIVIVQFASHEWADLDLDTDRRIVGDQVALSRLISLGRLAFRWYGIASAIFLAFVGTAGYMFLSGIANDEINWVPTWLTLVVLSALNLCLLPWIAILEGCNQVANVYQLRFIQGVFASLGAWCVLYLGAGLWIAPVSAGMVLLFTMGFLFLRYRSFLAAFLVPPGTQRIGWYSTVWPLQWRFAINGLAHYFIFSLYTPVMFQYYGAIVAGQMGMTLALAAVVHSVAMLWLSPNVPRYGVLIATKRYYELDRLFFRNTISSIIVAAGSALMIWLVLYGLHTIGHQLPERTLPLGITGLFLIATVIMQISQCLGYYLIAHQRNPMFVMGIVTGLANGLLIWVLGSRFGPSGAAIANLAVVSVLIVPWHSVIWYRCRSRWHAQDDKQQISDALVDATQTVDRK